MRIKNIYILHSQLQKAIRLGLERDALDAAYQLDMVPGDSFSRSRGGSMWSILRRCCAEDVDSLAILPAIEALWHFWEKQCESRDNKHEPWRLFTFKAVIILAAAPKSRKVDNALQVIPPGKLEGILAEFRKSGRTFKVPAYAIDGIHDGSHGGTKLEFLVNEVAAMGPKSGTEDMYSTKSWRRRHSRE